MSIDAVAAALKAPIDKSTKKFVLVCMANYADDRGWCWPSLATLARDTAQNIKTVRANVRELCADGYLQDTGRRVGQTQEVIVYKLKLVNPTNNGNHTNNGRVRFARAEKQGSFEANPTKIGTVPKTDVEPYQKREGNPTKNDPPTLPKLVGRTVREPSLNHHGTVNTPADAGLMEKLAMVRARYPKRAGTQPWRRAAGALRARLKAGADFQEILEGIGRYQVFCKATGKIGTETVLQAATFLGPDEHYRERWELPLTKGEVKQQSNVDASLEWLAEQEAAHGTH